MINATLSHQSDLMTNYMASSAVSAAHPVSTVLDDSGNPVVFSIGTDNELWMTFRGNTDEQGPQTGWVQFNLTSDIEPSLSVVAFDTVQNESGQFAVSIATALMGSETSSRVYVTPWLSNDMSATDWQAFSASSDWVLRSANIPLDPGNLSSGYTAVENAVATRVLMGEGGLNNTPLVIVVTDTQGTAQHYFVNGDSSSNAWSWAVYQMPQDAQTVLDICFGYMNAGGGVYGTYILYTIDNITSLYFVSTVTPVGPDSQPYIHQLVAPDGAQCLAALPTSPSGFTNLYVGGLGVSFFSDSTQTQKISMGGGQGVIVITPDELSDIQQLILAQDSGNVSLWALDQENQNVYYSSGPQTQTQSPSDWSTLLILQSGVAHMAANRNPQYQSNQIVTALSNNSLAYQWQDPSTSIWQHQDIPLQDIGSIQSFTSYTSTIHLTDEQDNSVINTPVSVSSQQWAYITVNGNAYEIGPDQSAVINSDANGNITIINKTENLNTPIYSVNLEGSDYQLGDGSAPQINPADTAIARMSSINTGADLQALFPDKNLSDDLANFGALTLSNLTQAMGAFPQDGTQQSANASTDVPNQEWGGYFHNGEFVPLSDASSFVGAVEIIAGDVIRMLEAAVQEIGQFAFKVAEGVVHFAVQVGEALLTFTLRAIGDALSLLNWVLETLLGISLQDIIAWLGALFGWDDIVTTHKVFANIAQQTVNALQSNLSNLEGLVNKGFDALLNKIDGVGSVPLMAPENQKSVNKIAQSIQPKSESGQNALNSALYESPGNFAYYQILHGGVMQGPIDDEGSGSSSLEDFLTGPLTDMVNNISDEIQTAVTQIVTDYNNGTLTVTEVVELVTKTVVESLVELLKTLVDAMFTILAEVMSLVDAMLFNEINIPLLTSLYELITDGSEMSLVDGICLLVAIPSTLFYKGVAGDAPFSDGTYGLDTASSMEEVLSILGVQMPDFAAAKVSAQDVAEGVEDAAKLYSQIGGAWSVISKFINSFASMAQALSEGELKFTSKVTTTMTLLYLASAIPLDSDLVDEGLDLGVYGAAVIDALLDAIMFLSPRAATFGEEEVNGGYTVVVSFWNLALNTVKFVYDLAEQQPQGDDLGWEIETYVQDIINAISTLSNGIAAVAGDENPEVELPAMAIAGGTQFISAVLGLTRSVSTIENDINYLYQ